MSKLLGGLCVGSVSGAEDGDQRCLEHHHIALTPNLDLAYARVVFGDGSSGSVGEINWDYLSVNQCPNRP